MRTEWLCKCKKWDRALNREQSKEIQPTIIRIPKYRTDGIKLKTTEIIAKNQNKKRKRPETEKDDAVPN